MTERTSNNALVLAAEALGMNTFQDSGNFRYPKPEMASAYALVAIGRELKRIADHLVEPTDQETT